MSIIDTTKWPDKIWITLPDRNLDNFMLCDTDPNITQTSLRAKEYEVCAYEKVSLGAVRYEFLRTLPSKSEAEITRIVSAMDIFMGEIGHPTPKEFDRAVDAGIAAARLGDDE